MRGMLYVLNQISGSAIGNLVRRASRWAEPTKRWRCSRTLCDCRTETPPVSLTAYLLARTGRAKEARQILDTLERRARDGYVPPVALAVGYLGLNDMEKVFVWLEKALAVHDVHLIYVPWDSKWGKMLDGREALP